MAKGVELLGRVMAEAAVAGTISVDDTAIGVGNDVKVMCYASGHKAATLRVMLSGDFDDLSMTTARNLADCVIGICNVHDGAPSADEARISELRSIAILMDDLLNYDTREESAREDILVNAKRFVQSWKGA